MTKTYYVWDEENDSLMEEIDENGNVIVSYTNEPGQFGKVISQERNGVTSYYHYDGQGSTVALTDDNENVTDTYVYSAFGELVSSTGTTVNPFRYVGQYGYYTDVETNDIYIRARSYNPSLGRWLTRDPIGYEGSEWDLYEYCRSRPLEHFDPEGLKERDCTQELRDCHADAADYYEYCIENEGNDCLGALKRDMKTCRQNAKDCLEEKKDLDRCRQRVPVPDPICVPIPRCELRYVLKPVTVCVGGGALAYGCYRVLRMVPSLFCPPTAIPNLICP